MQVIPYRTNRLRSGEIAADGNNQILFLQRLYGLKVFAEFMVIGLVLGWILYFIP